MKASNEIKVAVLKAGSVIFNNNCQVATKKDVKVEVMKKANYGFFFIKLRGKVYKVDFQDLVY